MQLQNFLTREKYFHVQVAMRSTTLMRHAVVAIGTVSPNSGQNVLEAVGVQGCLRLALGTEVRYTVTIPYRRRVALSCG